MKKVKRILSLTVMLAMLCSLITVRAQSVLEITAMNGISYNAAAVDVNLSGFDILFNADIDEETVNKDNIYLTTADGNACDYDVAALTNGFTVNINSRLEYNTKYNLTIYTDVTGINGEKMTDDKSITFTTVYSSGISKTLRSFDFEDGIPSDWEVQDGLEMVSDESGNHMASFTTGQSFVKNIGGNLNDGIVISYDYNFENFNTGLETQIRITNDTDSTTNVICVEAGTLRIFKFGSGWSQLMSANNSDWHKLIAYMRCDSENKTSVLCDLYVDGEKKAENVKVAELGGDAADGRFETIALNNKNMGSCKLYMDNLVFYSGMPESAAADEYIKLKSVAGVKNNGIGVEGAAEYFDILFDKPLNTSTVADNCVSLSCSLGGAVSCTAESIENGIRVNVPGGLKYNALYTAALSADIKGENGEVFSSANGMKIAFKTKPGKNALNSLYSEDFEDLSWPSQWWTDGCGSVASDYLSETGNRAGKHLSGASTINNVNGNFNDGFVFSQDFMFKNFNSSLEMQWNFLSSENGWENIINIEGGTLNLHSLSGWRYLRKISSDKWYNLTAYMHTGSVSTDILCDLYLDGEMIASDVAVLNLAEKEYSDGRVPKIIPFAKNFGSAELYFDNIQIYSGEYGSAAGRKLLYGENFESGRWPSQWWTDGCASVEVKNGSYAGKVVTGNTTINSVNGNFKKGAVISQDIMFENFSGGLELQWRIPTNSGDNSNNVICVEGGTLRVFDAESGWKQIKTISSDMWYNMVVYLRMEDNSGSVLCDIYVNDEKLAENVKILDLSSTEYSDGTFSKLVPIAKNFGDTAVYFDNVYIYEGSYERAAYMPNNTLGADTKRIDFLSDSGIDAQSLGGNITLTDESGNTLNFTAAIAENGFSIYPSEPLHYNTRYTVALNSAIKGADGNSLLGDKYYSFTTKPFITPQDSVNAVTNLAFDDGNPNVPVWTNGDTVVTEPLSKTFNSVLKLADGAFYCINDRATSIDEMYISQRIKIENMSSLTEIPIMTCDMTVADDAGAAFCSIEGGKLRFKKYQGEWTDLADIEGDVWHTIEAYYHLDGDVVLGDMYLDGKRIAKDFRLINVNDYDSDIVRTVIYHARNLNGATVYLDDIQILRGVYSQNVNLSSVSEDGENTVAEIMIDKSSMPKDFKLYTAAYTENGSLAVCVLNSITQASGDKLQVTLEGKNHSTIKVFAWDENNRPLTDVKKKLKREYYSMKIMTFNICSGTNYPENEREINLDNCGAVIKKVAADIVGLNEVHNGGIWGNQPQQLAEKLGYEYYAFARATYVNGSDYGNGFLSKYPIVSLETIEIPDPEVKDDGGYYETRCVLKAVINNGKDDISVYVTHFGLNVSEHKNAVETLLSAIGDNPEKTIVMGDLNVPPHNSAILKLKEKLVDSAGSKGDKLLTFPSPAPTDKIDYIFTSSDAVINSVYVEEKMGSDHRAYVCSAGF